MREGNVFNLSVNREGGAQTWDWIEDPPPPPPDLGLDWGLLHRTWDWIGGPPPRTGSEPGSGIGSEPGSGTRSDPTVEPGGGGVAGKPLAVTQEDCLVLISVYSVGQAR